MPKLEKGHGRPRIERGHDLPEVGDGAYLVTAFFALNSGALLPWAEIDAYARMTGVISEAWEAELMRAMSVAYLEGLRAGEDPLAYSPLEMQAL